MIPRQAAGFQAETLDGEVILFHPVNNTLIHSNESGALVWKLCDGQRSVEEIMAMLSAAYPDNAPDIAVDVPLTLQTLAEHGAIEWV